MQDNLIDQGINLMLFGMGTVFVFLTLLVFATTLMSKVVNRLVPEEVKDADNAPATSNDTSPTNINPRTLEAIKLAIKAHRSK
jgi:oxaloacetate decarboxylase gamma subunit